MMTTPFSPSLISLMVSVDVKHHVYLQLRTSQPIQFTGLKKQTLVLEDMAILENGYRKTYFS